MEVGLYGKLPTHGDFLRRRVTDDFVAAWDEWLQHCIADSRVALGEAWLETYLTSPVWRFSLAANVCGAAPVAGVLAPSVDRVGRYFPLTLLWSTPSELSALEVAVRFQRGFERAERLVLDTLALERIEFADFDRRVMELASDFEYRTVEGELRLTRASAISVAQAAGRSRCIPLRAVDALEAPAVQLLGCQLEVTPGAVGLWWTDGSAAVAPSWLITHGLPESSKYSAMLDGAWAASGWDVGEAEPETPFDATSTLVRADFPIVAMLTASAGLTDRGPLRPTNQDAFIERPDLNLWAIADGMGGLSEGEMASRMVCDALTDAKVAATLDEQIELTLAQLQLVNEHLRRAATRPVNPVQSGSTVVALLIRGKECAVIWAGDSRAYRLRDGLISQLTTDHSWGAEGGGAPSDAESQAITRAIGAEEEVVPDIMRSEVRVNDRLVLCSDGVGRVLDIAALGKILQTADPAACCAELIQHAIAGGGTDNATAIVVDCGAATHDE
jgi:type VI secretion system protein ImpM